MFNLKGRVAVITGASSGLGRQMAKAFAYQGADLVILARRIEKLEELKKELPTTASRCIQTVLIPRKGPATALWYLPRTTCAWARRVEAPPAVRGTACSTRCG